MLGRERAIEGARITVLASSVASIAVMLWAAPASAASSAPLSLGPPITRSAFSTGTGSGAIITATAICPPNTRATSGGFESAAPSPGSRLWVYRSMKVGNTAWQVSGQISPGAANGSNLTAYVYCRQGAPTTITAKHSIATPAVDKVGPRVDAACMNGRKAVAGGFSTPPPGASPKNLVLESFRSASSKWRATVASSSAGASTVTSYAYCAQADKLAPAAAKTSAAASPAAGDVLTAMARCAGQSTPVAGGFSQVGIVNGGSAFIPYESELIGQNWRASALALGFGPAITSHVYCG